MNIIKINFGYVKLEIKHLLDILKTVDKPLKNDKKCWTILRFVGQTQILLGKSNIVDKSIRKGTVASGQSRTQASGRRADRQASTQTGWQAGTHARTKKRTNLWKSNGSAQTFSALADQPRQTRITSAGIGSRSAPDQLRSDQITSDELVYAGSHFPIRGTCCRRSRSGTARRSCCPSPLPHYV